MITPHKGESLDDFPTWDMEKIVKGVCRDYITLRPDCVEEWMAMSIKPDTDHIVAARLVKFLASAYKTPGYIRSLHRKCPGWIGHVPDNIPNRWRFWTFVYDNWFQSTQKKMRQSMPLFAQPEESQ